MPLTVVVVVVVVGCLMIDLIGKEHAVIHQIPK